MSCRSHPIEDPNHNEVYAKHFTAPFPNRGTFYISGLAIPGLRIEIVAQAHIPEKR